MSEYENVAQRVREECTNETAAPGPCDHCGQPFEAHAFIAQTCPTTKPAPDPGDTPVCPHCGSDDIAQDATARYNPETGAWELADFFDTINCNGDCGGEEIGPITRREFIERERVRLADCCGTFRPSPVETNPDCDGCGFSESDHTAAAALAEMPTR